MADNTSKSTSEFVDELGKLGENMGNLLKNVWNMDERKFVETELRSGLDQFGRKFNETLDQLEIEANVKKARVMARDAWESAGGPKIVEDLRSSVLESLRRLNVEMAQRTQSRAAHEAKGPHDGTVI